MSLSSFLYRKQKLIIILILSLGYFLLRSPTAINSIKLYTQEITSKFLPTTNKLEELILDMSPKALVLFFYNLLYSIYNLT